MQSRILKLAVREDGETAVYYDGEPVLETVHMDEALQTLCSYARIVRDLFALRSDAYERHIKEEAKRSVLQRLTLRHHRVPVHPKV